MKRTLYFIFVALLLATGARAQVNSEYHAWVTKANAFYEAKQYKESAEAFTKAFATMGGKAFPDDRYNAACAWALAENSDTAFSYLDRLVVRTNYSDYDHLTGDPDLVSLHTDKRWEALCTVVKKNKDKEEADLDKSLVALLDTVFHHDQDGRMQLDGPGKSNGNDERTRKLWEKISYYDSVDLLVVEKLLAQYGWPGPDIVGKRGSQTIFLVIQHAEIKTQEKYLPMMREAVKQHKAEPSDLALLEDRVAMRHGGKQLYGSQILNDVEGSFLSPLEDPDNVDKRRAEMGLGPLAEYLSYFGMTWDLEAYKKQLPHLEERQKKITFN